MPFFCLNPLTDNGTLYFLSACLENIISEADTLLCDGEKNQDHKHLKAHNFVKCNADYCKMITCLEKHQLAIEFVPRKIWSSIIKTIFAHVSN